MTSINTNNGALAALQTLRNINNGLTETQGRVSSGLRIQSASDNSAYWSIATTMKADNKAQSAVSDALGLGSALLETTYEAMDKIRGLVEQIQTKVVNAGQAGADRTKLGTDVAQLQAQISDYAAGANFNGQNLLKTGATNLEVVSSFTNNGTTSSISTMVVTATVIPTALTGTLGAALISGLTDTASVNTALGLIEDELTALTTAQAKIGSQQSRIDQQTEFTKALMAATTSGVGKLIDADMEEESSRLTAQQTQQQLGIQALSIANQATQSVLTLFRG